MADIGKPRPQFLKYVAKPAKVSAAELAKARPVYIANLPEGEAVEPEVTEAEFNALKARVLALEEAAA